jgi:nitroimidazol reductase NimA-like FMN-containing flavoprotein (pyridoxamine 5'-phosphate oxidase superfamily)
MSLAMTTDERQAFLADLHVGVLSVAAGGGAPLTLPIWYAYEPGGDLWIITGSSSRKATLIAQAGRFSLCAQTEAPPYRYVSVEGPVRSVDPADVEKHTRPMARRYLGDALGDQYIEATEGQEGGTGSVIIRMRPDRWRTTDYAKQYGNG